MIKKIKKYGNTVVINFTKEELEAYGLKVGDFINVSDLTKVKVKKKRSGR